MPPTARTSPETSGPEGARATRQLYREHDAIPSRGPLAALTVPGAIEAAQRRKGFNRGLFEWLRKAPWGNPAFAGMFLSLVMFGFLGGISGVVLGTEQLNILMHNTLYVPGHFHGTVVAGTTLSLLAALAARAADSPPLLLALDGVQDPQNFGAVIRSASAACTATCTARDQATIVASFPSRATRALPSGTRCCTEGTPDTSLPSASTRGTREGIVRRIVGGWRPSTPDRSV